MIDISKFNQLVMVQWFDSWGGTNFYSVDGNHTPMIVTDVGFLMEENDETIVLTNEVNESGLYRGVKCIPWDNVLKVEHLCVS